MKTPAIHYQRKNPLIKKLIDQRYLLMLSIPFVIWLVVFAYIPLVGWLMAFQDYKPNKGFFGSEWVGLYHFKRMFTDPILAPKFRQVLWNTIGMSGLGLLLGFPVPIIFAILINELKYLKLKRFVQTISYLPHFVSWVIVANIVTAALSPKIGRAHV